MDAAKSISTIFRVNSVEFGKHEAVSITSTIMAVVLQRLIEEGLEINEINISEKLAVIAQDYIEASSSNVA